MTIPPAPAPQDTPPESAPEGTPDTEPEVDYRKRYEDLRPTFDRTSQEAAQLRAEMQRVVSDPDYQRELMAAWGYEVEDPTADPGDDLRAQLDELREWKESLTAEQQQAAQLQKITASVDEQFRAVGAGLDDSTKEWITTRALNMDPREDGMPDIASAYKAFSAWETERQNQWKQTKRRAPHIAAGGTEATQVPDLDKMNPTELAEWMAEEAMARMNS